MIAARLYKGLVTETTSVRSLYHDERLKMTMPQACYYCGSQRNLAVGHLIPRLRGGPDEADNLIWACRACEQFEVGSRHARMDAGERVIPVDTAPAAVPHVSRHCSPIGCMDVLLEDVSEIDLPFDVTRIPVALPPLGELRLWVYPESRGRLFHDARGQADPKVCAECRPLRAGTPRTTSGSATADAPVGAQPAVNPAASSA